MNDKHKDEDIAPLSPEEIKAIGSIGIGPSKQDIFLNRHYRKLLWGGIGIAVIAGVAIAYASHRSDRRDEAGAKIIAAMKSNNPDATASAANYDTKLLQEISSEYDSTPSAATAKLLQGLNLLAGSSEQAAEGSDLLLAIADDEEAAPLLRFRALAALATRATADADNAKANAYWTRITQMGESPYTVLAYISLADIANSEGKTDDARRLYTQAETVAGNYRNQLALNTIKERLAMLDTTAPRTVAPLPQTEQPASTDSPLDTPLDNTLDLDTPATLPTGENSGSTSDSLTLPATTLPTE